MKVKSPCIYYCMLKQHVCQGCGRTREEIEDWLLLNDEERLKVIEASKKRMEEINKNTDS